jgi:hypothetical protein
VYDLSKFALYNKCSMLTKPFIKKQSVYVSLNTKILYLVVAVSSKKCPNRPRHNSYLCIKGVRGLLWPEV